MQSYLLVRAAHFLKKESVLIVRYKKQLVRTIAKKNSYGLLQKNQRTLIIGKKTATF